MFNKTVKDVMANFNRTINDLNAIAKREVASQKKLGAEVAIISAKISTSAREAEEATRIADKLKALVS